jgi:hypothetical protein
VLVALATEKPDRVNRAGRLKPVLNGLLQKNPKHRMQLREVEQRLRKIADVQNAVRLHQVPKRRFRDGLAQLAAPLPVTAAPAAPAVPDGVVERRPDAVPIAAVSEVAGPDALVNLRRPG